jgi:hypothetical protein
MYHIGAILMIGGTVALALTQKKNGRNKYGTCSIKSVTLTSQIMAFGTLLLSSIGALIV